MAAALVSGEGDRPVDFAFGRQLVLVVAILTIFPGVTGTAPPATAPVHVDGTAAGAAYHLSNTTSVVRWGLNTTSFAGVAISFGLGANVTIPAGSVEAGRSYATAVSLQTSGNAELSIRGLGYNRSFGIPALGTSPAIPISGANFSFLGYSLQVYAIVETSIGGNCTTLPANLGCVGNLSWTASGEQNFSLQVPSNETSGASIVVVADDLRLSFSIGVVAEGEAGPLGNVTEPIGSPVLLPSISGAPSNISSVLPVFAPPSVTFLTASPNPVLIGKETNVTVTVLGGQPPLTYAYPEPPPGCTGTNTSTMVCSIDQIGNFTIHVIVTDGEGSTAQGSATLAAVRPPAPPATIHPQAPAANAVPPTTWLVLAAVGGAIASGVAVFLWTRHRAGG